MTDYLLFIDTEASRLPKNWDLPYSAKDNWPYCLQVSWVVFTKEGKEVKQENHYIKGGNVKIASSATKIHGLTKEFLDVNGEDRKEVMLLLHNDLKIYEPLVVGHFMEFDRHMVGADFYRTGIENLVKKENTFCTMLATTQFVKNPGLKFFRLGELYEALFHTTLQNQHDALVDAKATAECFFELVKRNEIDEELIALQQVESQKQGTVNKDSGCIIPVLAILFFTILIIYWL